MRPINKRAYGLIFPNNKRLLQSSIHFKHTYAGKRTVRGTPELCPVKVLPYGKVNLLRKVLKREEMIKTTIFNKVHLDKDQRWFPLYRYDLKDYVSPVVISFATQNIV
jgi:hypothetical protein